MLPILPSGRRLDQVEIWTAFELASFLSSLKPKETVSIQTHERVISVDLVLHEERKIALEYDGCRYHGNLEKDLVRGESLAAKGWTLITLREEPLALVGEHSIPLNGQYAYRYPHRIAAQVLQYLHAKLGFEIEGLDGYLEANAPRARKEADAFISKKKQRYKKKWPGTAPESTRADNVKTEI